MTLHIHNDYRSEAQLIKSVISQHNIRQESNESTPSISLPFIITQHSWSPIGLF